MNLQNLATEQINDATRNIDECSSLDIIKAMNQEDETIIAAIRSESEKISELIELAVTALQSKGRVIYVGAGTSGRLGVLDASEIPPTFNSSGRFLAIIAGGERALRSAVEHVEDNHEQGEQDIESYQVGLHDVVIGITASGRTPYVGGAIQMAKASGAKTGLIACNKPSLLSKEVDVAIELDTGPEIIMGSTRLKAGTAQKMVLNMISTGAMIRVGKVYKNLMVDLQTNNGKLHDRAVRIIHIATGASFETAKRAYRMSGENVKVAIVHLLTGKNMAESTTVLDQANGKVREAINLAGD